MFVAGNTVYALLRDALYLTQVGDKPQFERHNVSQLVTIDIADLRNPQVLKTIDIRGQLREGVSRKIENTIYVVSYCPQTYFWGWRPEPRPDRRSRPGSTRSTWPTRQNARKAGELQDLRGRQRQHPRRQGQLLRPAASASVAISATANALMVVENWHISASTAGTGRIRGDGGCGSYNSNQLAQVSLIDISDPDGDDQPARPLRDRRQPDRPVQDDLRRTTRPPSTGTFFGIFARQVWVLGGCRGTSYTQNTLESWDVSVRGEPSAARRRWTSASRNETVRGSAFDTDRKVAYAITAQRIDPLYALSFANRDATCSVLSEIDGLSGDMTRVPPGRRTRSSCWPWAGTTATPAPGSRTRPGLAAHQDRGQPDRRAGPGQHPPGAAPVRGGQERRLDRLGRHQQPGPGPQDAGHALRRRRSTSSPSRSTTRSASRSHDDWWWYRWETAVGLMTWDLTRYDASRPPRSRR